MRAAVLDARGSFRIDDAYPEPVPGPDDILLKVIFSGICGSDLHEFVAGPLLVRMPVVLGHEFCAEVVAIGDKVRGFDPGDKTVGIIYPGCGRCSWCRRGEFTLCDMRSVAASERHGSFAELVCAPARQMFVVPANIPDRHAALIEPTAVAVHALRRARLAVGERVVIFGAGPLGLLITALARSGGASRVIVVEPAERRRACALTMGADLALDPADEIDGPIMDLTEACGAEVVFEVSGSAEAFSHAQNLISKKGRIILVAVHEGRRLELQANRMLLNEVDVLSSHWAGEVDFRAANEMVATRRINVEPLITNCAPLTSIQQAFEQLALNRGSQIKVLLDCRRSGK